MMMTSTGRPICDSGFGERGRAWQRNQLDFPTLADIEKSSAVEVEQPTQYYTLKDAEGQFVRRDTTEEALNEYIKGDDRKYTIEKDSLDSSDIDFTVSTYHYLVNSLSIDDVCEAFNELECKDWDAEGASGISEEQVKWLKKHGLSFGDTWNSYNGDSNLSQTLQGCNITTEGNESNFEYPEYILLQLHQGADVRGGYTDAKLFKIESEYFDVNPTIYGSIDDVSVDTSYDGNTLRDENNELVPVSPTSQIDLYLN